MSTKREAFDSAVELIVNTFQLVASIIGGGDKSTRKHRKH